MAEIFGAVAAGIAICHEITRLAKEIHKVAKNIKNAPKDLGTLTDETVIFTGTELQIGLIYTALLRCKIPGRSHVKYTVFSSICDFL